VGSTTRDMPNAIPVALAKTVLEQSSATPFVPAQSFDADERQVPMGLGWPVMFGPLEDGADLGLLFSGNAFRNNRLERAVIAVNARWKPKRNAETVAGALRRPQTSSLQGLGIVEGCTADIDADRHTSSAQPGQCQRPERAWRWHGRFRRRRQWSRQCLGVPGFAAWCKTLQASGSCVRYS